MTNDERPDLIDDHAGVMTTLRSLERPLPTVLTQLEPLLSAGAFVIADMSKGDPDHDRYRLHVNDPAAGYTSIELPLDAGVVISARERCSPAVGG